MSELLNSNSQLLAAAQRLDALGFVPAQAGNLSCRLAAGNILITPSGLAKGRLRDGDLLIIDHAGRPINTANERRPSSETALHLALYQAEPAIMAIIHAHPPYATALAGSGRDFDPEISEEARILLGPLPLLRYRPAGSAALAEAAAAAAPGHKALLLANHGVVTWGESFEQALLRLEALEQSARLMLYRHLWQLAD